MLYEVSDPLDAVHSLTIQLSPKWKKLANMGLLALTRLMLRVIYHETSNSTHLVPVLFLPLNQYVKSHFMVSLTK